MLNIMMIIISFIYGFSVKIVRLFSHLSGNSLYNSVVLIFTGQSIKVKIS